MDNLKTAVIQDLEHSGFLDKLRAELRAKLFKTAELHENKAQVARQETAEVLSSELGQICTALIKDFLESFKLNYSLSVFIPECHLGEDRADIEELEQMFQVKSEVGKPLLFSVIEYLMQNTEHQENSQELKFTPPLGTGKSGSESISEDILSQDENEQDTKRDALVESQATSSLGADMSVNSLALDDYDVIEPVRKSRA